jgi:hypothetical protein
MVDGITVGISKVTVKSASNRISEVEKHRASTLAECGACGLKCLTVDLERMAGVAR